MTDITVTDLDQTRIDAGVRRNTEATITHIIVPQAATYDQKEALALALKSGDDDAITAAKSQITNFEENSEITGTADGLTSITGKKTVVNIDLTDLEDKMNGGEISPAEYQEALDAANFYAASVNYWCDPSQIQIKVITEEPKINTSPYYDGEYYIGSAVNQVEYTVPITYGTTNDLGDGILGWSSFALPTPSESAEIRISEEHGISHQTIMHELGHAVTLHPQLIESSGLRGMTTQQHSEFDLMSYDSFSQEPRNFFTHPAVSWMHIDDLLRIIAPQLKSIGIGDGFGLEEVEDIDNTRFTYSKDEEGKPVLGYDIEYQDERQKIIDKMVEDYISNANPPAVEAQEGQEPDVDQAPEADQTAGVEALAEVVASEPISADMEERIRQLAETQLLYNMSDWQAMYGVNPALGDAGQISANLPSKDYNEEYQQMLDHDISDEAQIGIVAGVGLLGLLTVLGLATLAFKIPSMIIGSGNKTKDTPKGTSYYQGDDDLDVEDDEPEITKRQRGRNSGYKSFNSTTDLDDDISSVVSAPRGGRRERLSARAMGE